MPHMPGGVPSGIFAHASIPPMDMEGAADFVQEKVEMAMNIMPGEMSDRFKREAKGSGGRLPNRTG